MAIGTIYRSLRRCLPGVVHRGNTFGRLLGTSAGAITATLLAAGYSSEEMLEALVEGALTANPYSRPSWVRRPLHGPGTRFQRGATPARGHRCSVSSGLHREQNPQMLLREWQRMRSAGTCWPSSTVAARMRLTVSLTGLPANSPVVSTGDVRAHLLLLCAVLRCNRCRAFDGRFRYLGGQHPCIESPHCAGLPHPVGCAHVDEHPAPDRR